MYRLSINYTSLYIFGIFWIPFYPCLCRKYLQISVFTFVLHPLYNLFIAFVQPVQKLCTTCTRFWNLLVQVVHACLLYVDSLDYSNECIVMYSQCIDYTLFNRLIKRMLGAKMYRCIVFPNIFGSASIWVVNSCHII